MPRCHARAARWRASSPTGGFPCRRWSRLCRRRLPHDVAVTRAARSADGVRCAPLRGARAATRTGCWIDPTSSPSALPGSRGGRSTPTRWTRPRDRSPACGTAPRSAARGGSTTRHRVPDPPRRLAALGRWASARHRRGSLPLPHGAERRSAPRSSPSGQPDPAQRRDARPWCAARDRAAGRSHGAASGAVPEEVFYSGGGRRRETRDSPPPSRSDSGSAASVSWAASRPALRTPAAAADHPASRRNAIVIARRSR